MENAESTEVLKFTAQIVSAYLSNNAVRQEEVSDLITKVSATLSGVGVVAEEKPRQEPAVAIKKSVFPDRIICLFDGKPLKMLKRHLQTAYNMTPEEYRTYWGLPSDYPMVAPDYAEKRSTLAKSIGLGRKASQTGSRPAAARNEPPEDEGETVEAEAADTAPAKPAARSSAKGPAVKVAPKARVSDVLSRAKGKAAA